MSLISSMSRGARILAADMGSAPAPYDDFWYAPAGGFNSSAGMRVTPDTVKRLAALHACVNIIGRNMSSMPVSLYRESGDGTVENKSHQTYSLLADRPNDWQNPMEFIQMMQGHLELRGNAYAEMINTFREGPEQLIPLDPDHVTPLTLGRGRMKYRYNDPITGETRDILMDSMFHLRNWSADGYVGQSTVAMATDTFGGALARVDYTNRYFQNDSTPGGIIEGAAFRDKTDEEGFMARWKAATGGANRHKTRILPLGLTYKPITATPKDAELLDALKFDRIQIASLFPVPPHLIGETEKAATYASVEQFNIMFATQCLLPRVILWEQAIRRSLIFDGVHYPKFSMANVLRGDATSRAAFYEKALANGWMCQNDVRKLEGLDPVDGGDTFWRPSLWAPLTDTSSPNAQNGPGGAEPKELGTTAHVARLKILASSAVDRCVRKESAVLKKMAEKGLEIGEVKAFYADHCKWLCDVLRIDAPAAQSYIDWRMAGGYGTDNHEEQLATAKLIDLAVERPGL